MKQYFRYHLWNHGAELGVAECADGREDARGRPHRQRHSDGARVVEDAGRRDEDARADDDPHDDADAVQQTQLPLRKGGQTGFGPEVRLSKGISKRQARGCVK